MASRDRGPCLPCLPGPADEILKQEHQQSQAEGDAQREGLLGEVELIDGDEGEPEAEEADNDEEPACPACGCTKPLKKGKCRDCGLHLG